MRTSSAFSIGGQMPRTKKGTPPSYRKHSSGQAIVTLPLGSGRRKDILLGPYGSPESHEEYERLLGEWRVNGGCVPEPAVPAASDITLNELMVRYLAHADAYYV